MTEKRCVLEAKDLVFSYETTPNVIRGISMKAFPGERIIFLGGNGEGKSTLLYLLAGLFPPESGAIEIDGERVDPGKDVPPHLRKKTGFLFQESEDQILGATVYEDISFGPMNMKLEEEDIRSGVERAIEMTGLEGLEERPTHYLSGGEKKRLCLASTFVMEPKILFCDEPFNSLDSSMKEKVENYLWDYSLKGNTLLLATHDVDFAWRFATRILLIHGGQILLDQAPEDFFQHKQLLEQVNLPMPLLLSLAETMGCKGRPKTLEEFIEEQEKNRHRTGALRDHV